MACNHDLRRSRHTTEIASSDIRKDSNDNDNEHGRDVSDRDYEHGVGVPMKPHDAKKTAKGTRLPSIRAAQVRAEDERAWALFGSNYGQFSKFYVCFCGLDPGNLKFETVRTPKQHICF